ncbi:helix-turn-helix transcriptional regulator [Picosynechococcus sp. NKBG042902]|uniref:helix-turn-helix domain-containing protein n=1 Tax=Picosynechococcus sp. NKBG042902 TaxID=490193 RepID=UPI0004AB0B20|nr:helix-turn-helix transcriptional regulator [Picosynechococcus sp. NKBG042902]
MNNLLEKKSNDLTSTSARGSMIDSQSQSMIPRGFFARDNTIALDTIVDLDWLTASDSTTSGVNPTAVYYYLKTPHEIQSNTQKSINELRRLSGLTWEQLARLFNVSRRTLHFWASGQQINSSNEEKLNRLLGVIKYINRGSASLNRNLLLMPIKDGILPFDLLVDGKYQEVKNISGSGNAPQKPKLNPLSEDALELRRPVSPENLIDALQDPIEPIRREARRSRPAKSVRSRKNSSGK